jgi:hypothetical protein
VRFYPFAVRASQQKEIMRYGDIVKEIVSGAYPNRKLRNIISESPFIDHKSSVYIATPDIIRCGNSIKKIVRGVVCSPKKSWKNHLKEFFY